MKTKRRHELQTNWLADWLGNQIETIKPYSQAIVGGLILIVVVVGFIVYMAVDSQREKAAAWTNYLYLSNVNEPNANPEDLKSLAGKNPGSPVGSLALHAAADRYLSEGISELYTDRKTALKTLESAELAFGQVLQQGNLDPLLRSRARYGLAMALESQGKLDDAKEMFTKVADSNPNKAIGRLALRSVRRLEDPAVKEFYSRFKDYERPSGSSISDTEQDPLAEFPDLPDRPDLSFPGSDDFDLDLELNDAGNESEDAKSEKDDKGSETDESSKESEKKADDKKSSDKKASDESSEKKKSD